LSNDILSQSFNFDGQVVLVTGSGRGLGRMIAETLLNGGAAIALHDIDEAAPAAFGESPGLTALAASLSARGGAKVTSVIGDISKEEDTKAIVQKVEGALGPISILVNCAGGDIAAKGGKPNPNDALNISLEDAHAVMNRNFIGTMLMCRAVVPGMVQRRKGAVINFGSLNGHIGVSPEVVYGCAKAAILHYTRCLALDMRSHGVRVNAVSPGPTTTARFLATRSTDPGMMDGVSLERYAKPAEIANAVAFLASSQAGFVNGQVLRVDGGMTLFAG
jgi:3-oxoacyl-[acyl-carrier protein] reductase